MNHGIRVAFEPWVPVFLRLMCRIGHSERFKITVSSFVIDNGARVVP